MPLEGKYTLTKYLTISNCIFNFNILAVIVSEIIGEFQIYIRGSCTLWTPLQKTFYIRNEYLCTGASIPPNTLEQAPPPSPSPPLPFSPLPSPPLRSKPLLLRLGGLGERFSSPSGSGRSPGRQTVFGEFQAKNIASSSNDLQELLRK